MKKLLTSVAIAAAACAATTSAHALVLVLDDFSAPVPGVVLADWDGVANNDASTADGSLMDHIVTAGVSPYVASRRIAHILDPGYAPGVGGACTGNCNGFQSNVGIGSGSPDVIPPGQLNMSNSGSIDSQVQVTWTLGPIAALVGAEAGTISIDIKTNNPGTTTGSVANFAQAYLDGVFLGNYTLFFPAPGTTFISLTSGQMQSLADGGTFRLDFQGSPEWDVNIDNLVLTIPQPGTLALVGAALLGLGAAARRRANTKA